MYSDGTRLLASDPAESFRILPVAGCADRHGIGKCCGPVQAVADAQFEIGRNQQRQLGILLQTVQQIGSFIGLVLVEEWRLITYRHCK